MTTTTTTLCSNATPTRKLREQRAFMQGMVDEYDAMVSEGEQPNDAMRAHYDAYVAAVAEIDAELARRGV